MTMAMTDDSNPDTGRQTVQSNSKRKRHVNVSNKRRKKDRVPTSEELLNLREAETMFHSNLFKMQVEELMKELKDSLPNKDEFEMWMQLFTDFLMNIPEDSNFSIQDYSPGDAVQIPVIQTPTTNKGNFKFVPPTNIRKVGSFGLGTISSSTPVVDVAVEIPKACWQGMDFLNHRYHRKRALYLSCLANSLLKAYFVDDLKFGYQDEFYLKPTLLVSPKGLKNVTVCVIVHANSEALKLNKFIPLRNNVRTSWFWGTLEDIDQPTPFYNSSVLSDLMLTKLNEYLEETISSQSIKDGLILLKLWSTQRGLTKAYGRLNGFILTMFVAYFLKKKKISPLMSAYQVFRCALLGFRNENLISQSISLGDETADNSTTKQMQSLFDVVFTDETGTLNLCYLVAKETILRVQHEAKIGLTILDKELPDNFSQLFMNKIPFSQKFDYLLHLKGPKRFKKYVKKLDLSKKLLDLGEDTVACVMPKICDVLKKGLNSRISLLDVKKESIRPWAVSESPPNPSIGLVTIGFLLNPDVPLSNIEKGPVSDDPSSKEFRNFWGECSELRRFQDGTIREAVVWEASTTADKRKVFCEMITDILKRHMAADPNQLILYGTEVDCILEMPNSSLSSDFPSYGTGEEAHAKLMQSFNSLSKQLRSLKGLPLLIASIQGTSPAFRFSEVFPPLSAIHEVNNKHSFVSGHIMMLKNNGIGVPPYTPALKAIVVLEGSGKWPDDIEAIKRVKAAFHLKIAELVKSKFSLIAVACTTHADIFKDGFVFRVEVASHKEKFLMKQVKAPNGSIKVQDNKDSLNLEITTEIMPKLNSALHGLHQQHNTYGTACRLAKRWISAQLKHCFIHDITVELIVASIYIHPEPYSCPSSPQVGFIRFLTLLATHDWARVPLVVNINDEIPAQEMSGIFSSFTSQRSTLPPMVIVTPYDRRGSLWTKNMPVALILKRIIILAKASLKSIDNILSRPQISDIKVIFRPPLESYDVLIHLKRNELARLTYSIDINVKDILPVHEPYRQEVNEVYPIVDYDPVQMYLSELKTNFGEFAFFLHDTYGGDFIAVVWKRSAFVPKELKASNINCRTLHVNKTQVVPDVERIIEDFKILGSGIVKNIVIQTENWQIQ